MRGSSQAAERSLHKARLAGLLQIPRRLKVGVGVRFPVQLGERHPRAQIARDLRQRSQHLVRVRMSAGRYILRRLRLASVSHVREQARSVVVQVVPPGSRGGIDPRLA